MDIQLVEKLKRTQRDNVPSLPPTNDPVGARTPLVDVHPGQSNTKKEGNLRVATESKKEEERVSGTQTEKTG